MKRKLLSLLLVACCMGASSCALFSENEKVIVSDSIDGANMATIEVSTDDMVAIRVLDIYADETLLNVMVELKSRGLIDFDLNQGMMVTSINGKANPADWSYCWMLYTSDTEMANNAWGEVEYQGEKLGSAVVGADFLPAVEGEVYVWYYQSF